MYLKDKLHRVTIRLNEKQFRFLRESSKVLDVKPSEFLRLVVTSTMATSSIMSNTKLMKKKPINANV